MTEVLRVLEPGLFTTIQDLGRPQAVASGVPRGGAMDRFAHSAANLLVFNDRSAPTLECTLVGPRLVAEAACVVAIAGADLDARLNDQAMPAWTSVAMAPGDVLAFGRRRAGARAYVAVGGGFAGDRWLGSASTYLMAGRGGMHGRALKAGDVLSCGESWRPPVAGRELAASRRPDYMERSLRVIDGPHFERLSPDSRAALVSSTFSLGTDSNRMGYRLDGPALDVSGDELLSFGLVEGALQVPSGGRPILLMADHQTAGGYPVVAVVASASMPAAAQLAPGDELRFLPTTIEHALGLRAVQRDALDSIS
ncbi:MAG TPA: biotin-dependent carboxyltransferase family protein [Candidatus Dormibacteraeota bacterium]|nr:biotin-dependent carboxyltransferase family protein [Candidatus Dormibacteraeota bacterium]